MVNDVTDPVELSRTLRFVAEPKPFIFKNGLHIEIHIIRLTFVKFSFMDYNLTYVFPPLGLMGI